MINGRARKVDKRARHLVRRHDQRGPRLVLEDRRRRKLRLPALARTPGLAPLLREDRLGCGQHGECEDGDGNEAYAMARHDALPGMDGSACRAGHARVPAC